jgi:hypothetical protein
MFKFKIDKIMFQLHHGYANSSSSTSSTALPLLLILLKGIAHMLLCLPFIIIFFNLHNHLQGIVILVFHALHRYPRHHHILKPSSHQIIFNNDSTNNNEHSIVIVFNGPWYNHGVFRSISRVHSKKYLKNSFCRINMIIKLIISRIKQWMFTCSIII